MQVEITPASARQVFAHKLFEVEIFVNYRPTHLIAIRAVCNCVAAQDLRAANAGTSEAETDRATITQSGCRYSSSKSILATRSSALLDKIPTGSSVVMVTQRLKVNCKRKPPKTFVSRGQLKRDRGRIRRIELAAFSSWQLVGKQRCNAHARGMPSHEEVRNCKILNS